MVGGGLLTLFALDLAQAMAVYRPFNPEDDQALVLQVIERIAVPLVAYVLIFWWESPAAGRFELTVRKLLSMGSLLFSLACVGLAIMAVQSGVRLENRATQALDQQARERTATLDRLAKEIPQMPPNRVRATYQEVTRRPEVPLEMSTEEMRAQMLAALPEAHTASQTAWIDSTARARRLQFLMSAKYFFGGIIAAVLFFLIWDATHEARAFVIFGRRSDPTLSASERWERLLDAFRLVPDFEEYSWYRRLSRQWRARREKRNRSSRSTPTHPADR